MMLLMMKMMTTVIKNTLNNFSQKVYIRKHDVATNKTETH